MLPQQWEVHEQGGNDSSGSFLADISGAKAEV